jgi:hypothetical protein
VELHQPIGVVRTYGSNSDMELFEGHRVELQGGGVRASYVAPFVCAWWSNTHGSLRT